MPKGYSSSFLLTVSGPLVSSHRQTGVGLLLGAICTLDLFVSFTRSTPGG